LAPAACIFKNVPEHQALTNARWAGATEIRTRNPSVINMVTAKARGVTVPRMLLGRADEMIE
jgi:hypothetical protein